jgi:hypothetical protein
MKKIIISLFYLVICNTAFAQTLDLVRVNRHGETVSSDLGSYQWFECSNEGEDRTCKFGGIDNIMSYFEVIQHYLEGSIIYAYYCNIT